MLTLQHWGQSSLPALAPLLLPSRLCVTLSISLAISCADILYFSFATVPKSSLPLKCFCMCAWMEQMLRGVPEKRFVTPWTQFLLWCPAPLCQTDKTSLKHNVNAHVPQTTYVLERRFLDPAHLPIMCFIWHMEDERCIRLWIFYRATEREWIHEQCRLSKWFSAVPSKNQPPPLSPQTSTTLCLVSGLISAKYLDYIIYHDIFSPLFYF